MRPLEDRNQTNRILVLAFIVWLFLMGVIGWVTSMGPSVELGCRELQELSKSTNSNMMSPKQMRQWKQCLSDGYLDGKVR